LFIKKIQLYLPFVFGLLLNKKQETYFQFLIDLKEKCKQLNLILEPKEIVVDFESAIHKACSAVWNNVIIVGCRFHLCQSWYRKIQQLGLGKDCKDNNSLIDNYLKLYFGMQFLGTHEVLDFFNTELFYLIPNNDSRVIQFRNYLYENYISTNSTFPPTIWASSLKFLYRTTNNCESFHAKFNSSFYNTHPNIFLFTQVLLSYQTDIQCIF
jgi:hypothetical protein